MLLCYFFFICLFYCHDLYKKIQGDQILRFFFMYLLFLGIVQKKLYAMKLKNALTQTGKLRLGDKI